VISSHNGRWIEPHQPWCEWRAKGRRGLREAPLRSAHTRGGLRRGTGFATRGSFANNRNLALIPLDGWRQASARGREDRK
jgi:hypothetical protein